MTAEIKLCDRCWRAVSTIVVGRDRLPGGVEVPLPHQNAEGDECDGGDTEVITGWGLEG